MVIKAAIQIAEGKNSGAGRRLSAESANSLKALAQRSPEKLRKKLEKLAALAGESTSAAD